MPPMSQRKFASGSVLWSFVSYWKLSLCIRVTSHCEEWEWDPLANTETGQQIMRVSKTRNGVNLYNKNDWHEVFTFFESRLLAIDSFWCEFGELFLVLSK